MAKALYDEVGGVARKVTKKYDGVAGVSRKVTKCYDGAAGVARQYFSSGVAYSRVSGYWVVDGTYSDIYDLYVEGYDDVISGSFSTEGISVENVSFHFYVEIDNSGKIIGVKTDNPPPELSNDGYPGNWINPKILNPETFANGYIDFSATYTPEGADAVIIRITFE